MKTTDWTLVYTTNQRYMAEIRKAILDRHEIKCVVFNRQDSLYTHLGEIELYVPAYAAKEALELISDASDFSHQ